MLPFVANGKDADGLHKAQFFKVLTPTFKAKPSI